MSHMSHAEPAFAPTSVSEPEPHRLYENRPANQVEPGEDMDARVQLAAQAEQKARLLERVQQRSEQTQKRINQRSTRIAARKTPSRADRFQERRIMSRHGRFASTLVAVFAVLCIGLVAFGVYHAIMPEKLEPAVIHPDEPVLYEVVR